MRLLVALSAALLALNCGRNGHDESSEGAAGAQPDSGAANECGGQRELRFDDAVSHVGDSCGECGDGKLICGSLEALVCVGAQKVKPACSDTSDAGASNACGGFQALTYAGAAAAPGDACGVCKGGLLTCISPNQLSCIGETCTQGGAGGVASGGNGGATGGSGNVGGAAGGSANGGGGASGGVAGTAGSPSGGVGGSVAGTGGFPSGGAGGSVGGSGGSAGGASGPTCSAGVADSFQGEPAHIGDACGACGDGRLACSPYAGQLLCNAPTPLGYCATPQDAPNVCGGKGPITWDGAPASPGLRCGPCGTGTLTCSTSNILTCVTTSYSFTSACTYPSNVDTCAIPAAAYTATALHQPPAPPSETKPTASSFQSMGLTINTMVYNAFDRRIYASIPGSAGVNGNSVAVIDPSSQSVVQYVSTGNEPMAMALSDDGAVLWVENSGTGTVRRVDLKTLQPGLEFGLASFAARSVTGLAVLPGTLDSVLVVNGQTVTAFDAGVPRPNSASAESTLITATYSPSLAYGFDDADTGYGFTTYCVNPRGVFAQNTQSNIMSGFGSSLIFDSGVVYGSNGAYDIQQERVVGTYPSSKGIAIDSAAHRLFAANAWPNAGLAAYDLSTFVALGTDPGYPAETAFLSPKLVRWGRYGMAFTYSTDVFGTATLYVGKSTLIP